MPVPYDRQGKHPIIAQSAMIICKSAYNQRISCEKNAYVKRLQPLDKCSFIVLVVSAAFIKMQYIFLFGAGQQHDFITTSLGGNQTGIRKACRGKAPFPEPGTGDNIFN